MSDDGHAPQGLRGDMDLSARVLLLTPDLLALDKPAGLAVHPGPRTAVSLEDALDGLRFGRRERPQPAHRLDRDTSGCLLLGRDARAVRRLGALFTAGEVAKTYLACVVGEIADAGEIDASLAKISSAAAGWRMVVSDKGKSARTRWQVLARGDGRMLVELTPATGRTHQLRVHLAHIGAPIVGDPVYGIGGEPMRLHCARLRFGWRDAAVDIAAPRPAWASAL